MCSAHTVAHRFKSEFVGQRVDLFAHKLDVVERQTELLGELEGPAGTGVAARLQVAVHLGHVEGGAPGDVVQHLGTGRPCGQPQELFRRRTGCRAARRRVSCSSHTSSTDGSSSDPYGFKIDDYAKETVLHNPVCSYFGEVTVPS